MVQTTDLKKNCVYGADDNMTKVNFYHEIKFSLVYYSQYFYF